MMAHIIDFLISCGEIGNTLMEMKGYEKLYHNTGKHQQGWIYDIQKYSINDGPGIRTTVFFKGCPLGCLWCSNPESQYRFPQLLFFESLCTRCYRCVKTCPTGATKVTENGLIFIDHKLCIACGECVKVCLSDARVISGKLMTAGEIVDIVKKDALFYRNSGGGVTASGGEPTAQPHFLKGFLRKCQESGIHTTLDTCGYVQWGILDSVLENTELVFFDIKHMDPLRHKELTGVDNELILRNAAEIVRKGKPIRIRIPLIPGCNDAEENIKATGEFIVKLGVTEVDILPYHQLGANKYKRLGLEYKLSEIRPYREEHIEEIKGMLVPYGLKVNVA